MTAALRALLLAVVAPAPVPDESDLAGYWTVESSQSAEGWVLFRPGGTFELKWRPTWLESGIDPLGFPVFAPVVLPEQTGRWECRNGVLTMSGRFKSGDPFRHSYRLVRSTDGWRSVESSDNYTGFRLTGRQRLD